MPPAFFLSVDIALYVCYTFINCNEIVTFFTYFFVYVKSWHMSRSPANLHNITILSGKGKGHAMNLSVRKTHIITVLLMLALLVCLSGCAEKPSRSELQERLDADVSHTGSETPAETPLPVEPQPDAPTQTVGSAEMTPSVPAEPAEPAKPDESDVPDAADTPISLDEPIGEDGMPSDADLLRLLTSMEIGLTGSNTFTFRSASELTSEELYLSFLLLTPYDELNRCWDESSQNFYFTEDNISGELSKYYRDYHLDIRQNSGYDVAARAIVTPLASGFGGGRNIVIEDKTMENNILTVTTAFYDMDEETYEPENCKLRKVYTLERYDGGWYFLSAIEQPMTECAEPETAALLLTMLRRAQLVNIADNERRQYTQQADYKDAYLAYQQYFTNHAADFAAYAEAEGSWMCFYLLEGGLSCVLYAEGLDEVQLLYRPSSGVQIVSNLNLPT